jgi:hypothetical protein
MNTHRQRREIALDRQWLDRMVDGELTLAEQQALLLACEEMPHSWRDLAVAYVEAQALAGEFKSYARSGSRDTAVANPAGTSDHRVPEACGPGPDRNSLRSRSAALLAAAVLVSLLVGYGAGLRLKKPTPILHRPEAATVSGRAARGVIGQQPSVRAGWGQPMSPPSSVQVTVSDPVAGEFRQVDVPLIRAADVNPDWLSSLPSAIPHELVQALRGTGHQVEQQRSFVPLRLPDGRRVVLPVDEISVDFVGFQ